MKNVQFVSHEWRKIGDNEIISETSWEVSEDIAINTYAEDDSIEECSDKKWNHNIELYYNYLI